MAQSGSRVPSASSSAVARRPAGAELDADLRLGLQPRLLHLLDQPEQVVRRHGDEAAGDLDDVEAQLLALAEVAMDGLGPLAQHVLDEAAGGDQDVVGVAEVDQLADDLPRHEAERPAGELERVHVGAHRLQDILQVALAHRRCSRARGSRSCRACAACPGAG